MLSKLVLIIFFVFVLTYSEAKVKDTSKPTFQQNPYSDGTQCGSTVAKKNSKRREQARATSYYLLNPNAYTEDGKCILYHDPVSGEPVTTSWMFYFPWFAAPKNMPEGGEFLGFASSVTGSKRTYEKAYYPYSTKGRDYCRQNDCECILDYLHRQELKIGITVGIISIFIITTIIACCCCVEKKSNNKIVAEQKQKDNKFD